MRDRIVHHYEGLDPDHLAEDVHNDIPQLLAALRPVQAKLLEDWRRRQEELGEPAEW